MENRSKTGVLINERLRDSLIIDKYDKVFHHWRQQKLEHLRSENSEDALSWNVFRSLKQIDPSLWLPKLFKTTFQKEFAYSCISVDVLLWKRLHPPSTLTTKEGQTEVDIIIQTHDFVWFIEAKYKSDISMRTTHAPNRNQIIRNIDVGLEYAKEKDFYFSLLILDEQHSPKGLSMTNSYRNSIQKVKEDLPHLNDELFNLHGIGVFDWFDLHKLLIELSTAADSTLEKFVAKQARTRLGERIFQDPKTRIENEAREKVLKDIASVRGDGVREGKQDIAKKMLKKGMDLELIIEMTDFTLEEVIELRDEISKS